MRKIPLSMRSKCLIIHNLIKQTKSNKIIFNEKNVKFRPFLHTKQLLNDQTRQQMTVKQDDKNQ